jgi:hypothetical protein
MTSHSASAQAGTVQFFPETGHSVQGSFLEFYKATADPLLMFGYPITEQMISRDGRTVQYFQRARFELSPAQTVQLTPLGSLTYSPKNPLVINNPNACEVFSTGGYPVCLAFLEFYKAHDGPMQFGNPISPFESSDGLIVQYFEGARFEWRADRPPEQRVVITELGRFYFDQLKEDPAQLKPVQQSNATIIPVLDIKARAFVLKAVVLNSAQQTVYISVQSQTGQAVPNATGKALVKFPNGTSQEFSFTTNTRGIAQITFTFSEQKAGELIPIEISVNYQGLSATTKTSFRIWF